MISLSKSLLALAAVAALAVGCGGGDSLDVATEALAPAGSNAAMVSNTVPANMIAGERVSVSVTVRNTGAASPANDWPAGTYRLYRVGSSPTWSWVNTATTTTATVGNTTTVTFSITAPTTPGAYTFRAQMFSSVTGQTGFFGEILSVPVTVTAGTPAFSCTYVPGSSSVPTTLTPGANQSVTVAVQNTGTQPWSTGSFYLYSRNSPLTQWGVVNDPVSTTVAPGATELFTFTITAPTTAATYPFVWDMFQGSGGIGFFGGNCVNLSIDVGGSVALDSLVSADTFPDTMAPGETVPVTVSFQNTGTQTWTAGTAFALSSTATPPTLFGTTITYLTGGDVAPGATGTFSFPATAPTTPGTYTASYRMRKLTDVDAGFFGATFTNVVTVDMSATPSYAASGVSNTIPARMTAGETVSVDVTVSNTGTATWAATGFSLASTSTPAGLFGTTSDPLGVAVAPMTNTTFTFNLTGPATPGSYTTSWRMRGTGVGSFGDTISVPVVSTLCGNNTVDAGEQCDDDNLTNGDGCTDLCAIELPPEQVVNLATTNGGRALLGSGTSAVAAVTVGDVNDDAVPDVMVSRLAPPTGVTRSTCGVVFGFIGGAGFFTNTADALPSDAAFALVGAEAGDELGTYQTGNLIVGDVTGDGVEDIVVGAPRADGPSNARADGGEVYVITGGLGLSTAGTIDLGAMTPPTQLAATIYGAAAGDHLSPVAVADVTGDGFNDLVLGSPQTGAGGSDTGIVYIVAGTASGLSGTLDLAAPGATTVHTISGGVANDRLGRFVTVGDFTGDASLDILLGAPGHTHAATRDGAAYGFAGPFTGNRTIASADISWYGVANFDGLGSSVAVGDVRGTTAADVVIGVVQHQRSAGVQVGAVMVFDGPVAAGEYDLSAGLGAVSALVLGRDPLDNLGSATVLADVTGDGRLDIVSAARAADGPTNAAPNTGELVVVRGGSTLTGTTDLSTQSAALVIYGATSPGLIGSYRNTLSAGDIDGDGLADVCTGSNIASSSAGRVDCIVSPF